MATADLLKAYRLDIVVVASNHNPTILNPDWLVRNDIIQDEWGWELSEDPITLPVLSKVEYASDFSIVARPEQVIFSDSGPSRIPGETPVGEVAAKYVKTLPHVTYEAVGINPKACLPFDEREDACVWIAEHLLKEGPWMRYRHLEANSVRFQYSVASGRFLISIGAGEVEQNNEPALQGVLFQGNFHHDIDASEPEETASSAQGVIERWQEDFEAFQSYVCENLLEEEGQ